MVERERERELWMMCEYLSECRGLVVLVSGHRKYWLTGSGYKGQGRLTFVPCTFYIIDHYHYFVHYHFFPGRFNFFCM